MIRKCYTNNTSAGTVVGVSYDFTVTNTVIPHVVIKNKATPS